MDIHKNKLNSGEGADGKISARGGRRRRRVPGWVEVVLVIGLLGAAGYMVFDEHVLWGVLLAIGGLAFGGSFVLRRMVGDEYGRA